MSEPSRLPLPSGPACAACGAPIFWEQTAVGERVPVDAAPTPAGKYELRAGRLYLVSDDELPLDCRYNDHREQCPKRDDKPAERMRDVAPIEWTACRCGARIAFVRTRKGKTMPVQHVGGGEGNVSIVNGTAVVGGVGTGDHVAHFVTCPHATSFRKRGAR
jgi:hypothetical protein